jgi:putative aldouronate transport system permease protein
MSSRAPRERFELLLIYASLGVFTFVVIFPFINTVARSFSAEGPISRNQVFFLPIQATADAYRRLMVNRGFWLSFQNSILITVVSTPIQMGLTALAAYPLSRPNLPGRGFLMTAIVIQMIFPPGLIPFYLNVRQLGLINSYWAVILPYGINTFNMIVLKSFFQTIPIELEEAAIMDGANPFQVLFRIMLPLAVPAMGTISLFYAVTSWNMFLPAVFFINDGSKMPLQVVLREMIWSTQLNDLGASPVDFERLAGVESLKSACVIAASLPLVLAYLFLQKYFVKGITLGAVKG